MSKDPRINSFTTKSIILYRFSIENGYFLHIISEKPFAFLLSEIRYNLYYRMKIQTQENYDSLWVIFRRPYDFNSKTSPVWLRAFVYSGVLIFIPYYFGILLKKPWIFFHLLNWTFVWKSEVELLRLIFAKWSNQL